MLLNSFEAMISKRTQIMDKIRGGYRRVTEKDGVEFIGFANLSMLRLLRLRSSDIPDKFVLATGANSRKFPGFMDEDPRFLISDNIFTLCQSIVIVGGGPVGVELRLFHEFGVESDNG